MAVVHTTTAFVNAIKESANILKKNLAVIYVKDPYIDSDSEHEEETPEDENQPSNERIEEDMRPAIVKEETIQESKKVAVADESDDDRNSDNDLHMTGGENNFLNFDLLDLLNENAAEFNLELSKAQVGRLLSSVRIADRLEAAKDMDGLMEFLESLQAESEKMLDDTEATAEFTWKGLETKRQDIATLVGESNAKIPTLMKGFMEKVAQFRLETMDSLREKFARSAYDTFWDGLQDTIDRQSMRRKSLIDEEQSVEHSAEVAAEQQKRLKRAATDDAPAPVGAGAVATQILEAISLQQDETAYRKTRVEMETGKRQQYANLMTLVDSGADDAED